MLRRWRRSTERTVLHRFSKGGPGRVAQLAICTEVTDPLARRASSESCSSFSSFLARTVRAFHREQAQREAACRAHERGQVEVAPRRSGSCADREPRERAEVDGSGARLLGERRELQAENRDGTISCCKSGEERRWRRKGAVFLDNARGNTAVLLGRTPSRSAQASPRWSSGYDSALSQPRAGFDSPSGNYAKGASASASLLPLGRERILLWPSFLLYIARVSERTARERELREGRPCRRPSQVERARTSLASQCSSACRANITAVARYAATLVRSRRRCSRPSLAFADVARPAGRRNSTRRVGALCDTGAVSRAGRPAARSSPMPASRCGRESE